MNKRGNGLLGGIFIVLGALFLMKNLNIPGFYLDFFNFGFLLSRFWAALFLILPALAMHHGFFSGKNGDAGVLVPAGILLVTGTVCQLSVLFGIWHVMWPGFILSVAVGLFELYWFGGREKGILIPVFILGGLSLIFFTSTIGMVLPFRHLLIPLVLILLGVVILMKKPSGRDF